MPRSLGLTIIAFAEWPAADRLAWEQALADGGLFGESGALTAVAPKMLPVLRSAYGRWLGFLGEQHGAGAAPSGLDAATDRESVRAFVKRLGPVAPYSARAYVTNLLTACRAMRPSEPFTALHAASRHLFRTAAPVTDMRSRIVPSRELYRLGLQLMDRASEANTPLKQAGQYRDGLMIAMLASCPIRLGNFTALELGRSMLFDGKRWRAVFPAEMVKSRRPIDLPLPQELIAPVEEWLTHYRPACLARRGRWYSGDPGDAFWISDNGAAFARGSQVRERIERRTLEAFGKRINPHLFRHIAATSIAEEIPVDAAIIQPVLGHASAATGERYYNQARSVLAATAFHAALDGFRVPCREAESF